MTVQEKLNKLSEEVSVPLGGLKVLFNKEMKKVKEKNPDKTDEQLTDVVIERLKGRFSKQVFFGKAEEFVGMALGQSGLIDTVARIRREHQEMWERDKSQAVKEGYAKPDGTLIFKKDFGIRQKGSVIPEHSYIRHVIGVAAKPGESSPKIFHVLLADEIAVGGIPLYQPLRMWFTNRPSDNPSVLNLGQSTNTRWEKFEGEFPDMEKIFNLPLLKNKRIELSNLPTWHNNGDPKDRNRFFITRGTVMNIAPTVVQKTGNRVMYISDFGGEIPCQTFCWVPDVLINFGIGSTIDVIGNTTEINATLPGGEQTDEKQIAINVLGVNVIDRVAPEEVGEVTEQSVPTPPKEEEVEEKTEKEEKPEETKSEEAWV
ncbi:MAG: hypothetical protein ACE5WD_14955 [Candidatus Aminicenantia bacterium]